MTKAKTAGASLVMILIPAFITVLNMEIPDKSLVKELIVSEGCNPPCFFDHELIDMSFEEVESLIRSSPYVNHDSISVREESNGEMVSIYWMWSERGREALSSDDLFVYELDSNSNITFWSGSFWDSYFLFAIPLEELISELGPPRWISSAYRTRAGSMILDLIYEDPLGHFAVWTTCEAPKLTPESEVTTYYYRVNFQSDPTGAGFPLVEWEGYSTTLPNCSVFLP